MAQKGKRKDLWFLWRERFSNIAIISLQWKPHDLSMTFGKAEKISIIIHINMNKIMNVLVDKVS